MPSSATRPEATATAATAAGPVSPEAKAYLDTRDFSNARGVLERVVEAGSATPSDYAQLSELYLAAGLRDKGESSLRLGLTRHPDQPYLTFRLGSYLAALTRYEEAVPLLAAAATATPGDPAILKMLTVAQTRLGDRAAAASSAAKLYALVPGRDEGLLYAASLESAGELAAAERAYREVLEKLPSDAVALNNLAALLTRVQRLEEAEVLARRAIQQEPQNGRILDTLGSIQYSAGRHDEAADTFKRAVALAPNAANLRYHYGLALSAQGKTEAAQQALADARRLDPAARWPDIGSGPADAGRQARP